MDNCCCVELKVTEDPIIALDIKEQFISGGEITPTGTKEISVTQNGTTTTDVTYYANAKVVANVPNTYTASDEDKVVQDGALEAQTTATFEANDVYDTTTIKQVTVDVPASAVDSGYVYITENGTEDVVGYAQAVVNVPNTYAAGDEGKVVENGALVSQGSAEYTSNGTYDTTKISSVEVSVSGSSPSGTKEISISQNGTTTENVAAYASAEITVNVPNTYSAGDEGKVVSSGALVSQTSATYTNNDTYDTTLVNSVTVNVSGGGGGIDVTDAAVPIAQNTLGGLFKAMQEGTWDTLELTVTSGTNPIEIDFGRAIKGYVAYPKSMTVLSGLAKDGENAFAIAVFNDADGNGAQSHLYAVNQFKNNGGVQANLFNRISAYTLSNGLLSITPQYPTNENYHPFGFGNTYIFVYWWEASA